MVCPNVTYSTLAFSQCIGPSLQIFNGNILRKTITNILWHIFLKNWANFYAEIEAIFFKKWCHMTWKKNFFCCRCRITSATIKTYLKHILDALLALGRHIQRTFFLKTFSWESYPYWKQYFCASRGSFQAMVTYRLEAINCLLELLIKHT